MVPAVRPVAPKDVVVVEVPAAGGVELVVKAYSYPVTPGTAAQLILAALVVIPVAVRLGGIEHAVVEKLNEDQGE